MDEVTVAVWVKQRDRGLHRGLVLTTLDLQAALNNGIQMQPTFCHVIPLPGVTRMKKREHNSMVKILLIHVVCNVKSRVEITYELTALIKNLRSNINHLIETESEVMNLCACQGGILCRPIGKGLAIPFVSDLMKGLSRFKPFGHVCSNLIFCSIEWKLRTDMMLDTEWI